jgi:uncharacterized protein with NRDE domain
MAEVVKYGLIRDAVFFAWIEQNLQQLLKRDTEALIYAIERSCQCKAEIVAADERESGQRALLNLGHTFGHAIETGTGYGNWLHGEAVAAGMSMAADLSARHGWLRNSDVERIRKLLSDARLPVDPPTEMTPEDFLRDLQPEASAYAGFNLLVGSAHSLWYFTNSTGPGEPTPRPLAPGIYGLSNALLDTPWPKVETGKRRLRDILQQRILSHDAILSVVSDRELADAETLHQQGMGGDMDRLLSAQFITTSRYGTRSSTSLWVTGAGSVNWRELSFDARAVVTGQRQESFQVQST